MKKLVTSFLTDVFFAFSKAHGRLPKMIEINKCLFEAFKDEIMFVTRYVDEAYIGAERPLKFKSCSVRINQNLRGREYLIW